MLHLKCIGLFLPCRLKTSLYDRLPGLRQSSTPISKTSFRWVLVGWMFLVSAIAYLDRVNISIAGPSIAEEFHLTNVELGAVFSAFVLGYAFFQAPGGWLADRLGPRRVLMLGVIWWGLFTAAVTLVTPNVAGALTVLVAVRLLLGMGEAVVRSEEHTSELQSHLNLVCRLLL